MPRYIPTWNNPDDSVHTAAGTAVGACLVGSIGVGVGIGMELGDTKVSGVVSGALWMQPAEPKASRTAVRKAPKQSLCRWLKVGPV